MPLENTANRNYPKAHRANKLKDDVERLRQMADMLDIDVADLVSMLLSKASVTMLADYQQINAKDQPGGYAGIDANGFVPVSRIHPSLRGGLILQGEWNPLTDTPDLPVPSSANKGWFWICSVNGLTSKGGITDWRATDYIWSDGVTWRKIDNTDRVTTVAGRTGAVTLSQDDIVGVSRWKLIQMVDAVAYPQIDIGGLSAYDKVQIEISDLRISDSGTLPGLRLADQGGNVLVTGYQMLTLSSLSTGAVADAQSDLDNGSGFFIRYATDGGAEFNPSTLGFYRYHASLTFHGVGQNGYTYLTGRLIYHDTTGALRSVLVDGVQTTAISVDQISLIAGAGTITGRITAHGLLKP